jgi:hypothetical protein
MLSEIIGTVCICLEEIGDEDVYRSRIRMRGIDRVAEGAAPPAGRVPLSRSDPQAAPYYSAPEVEVILPSPL